jgi:hypothetical protein
MNFLPAIPISAVPAEKGSGGVALNLDGTLLASVVNGQHCVYIYSVVECVRSERVHTWCCACSVCCRRPTTYPVVVGIAGTRGSAYGQLSYPAMACFVQRNGVDTLFITDSGNDRIVEVTANGRFLRVIAMKKSSWPYGIAYCGSSGVIAVSLHTTHAVALLQPEPVKPQVTIGSGTGFSGKGDGQLHSPHGVTFTADGRYILVADCGNNRVSKFSSGSGVFVAHVATKAANGILWPKDVLQCEDGTVVVAHGASCSSSGSVVCGGGRCNGEEHHHSQCQ